MTTEREQNENQPQVINEAVDLVPDLLARRFAGDTRSYWEIVWAYFRSNGPAYLAMWIMFVMATVAVFAPFIANHRPYFMNIPAGTLFGAESHSLHEGFNLPLLRALDANDWVLIGVYFQAILAIWTFRKAKRSKMVVSRPLVGAMLIVATLPVLVALAFSPVVRSIFGPESAGRALQATGWPWWIVMLVLALVGIGLTARNGRRLIWQKRDQFGNLAPHGAIFGLFFGSFLLVIAAGRIGTLGTLSLDTTDYFQVAQREGVTAGFPPVAHDYLKSNSYMMNQVPMGPHTRVLPSGVSEAASDLGLMDSQREQSLAATRLGTPNEPLTPETPLAELNNGKGVRLQDDPVPEFTLVSHSFRSYAIQLYGAETLGDIFRMIETSTGGGVTAQVSEDGSRIVFSDNTPPRPRYWMGTGPGGSDVAARLVHATRVALSIGFVSTTIAISIGVIMGALMGYFGGWVDIAGMRIIEIFMAIPRLFLLLTIIAFIPPELNDYMLYAMMAVIGATSWMNAARFIRAEFFKLRDQDFVQSAKACGLPMSSILFKHMLPNGVTPVLVDASFGVAAAIFIETGLSFLGFGIKPPHPSWGQMLSSAVDPKSGVFHWWLAIFPGIMIFLTVFCFNLIGDALRDAIDPKLRKANAV